MCGINAFIPFNDNLNINGGEIIKLMNHELNHRGPDDNGVFRDDKINLGHTRLKIIDLNGGKQPFFYQDLVLVFNGEVYNYEELKEELISQNYKFNENSDTEVMAAAFSCWGMNALNKFNGDFSGILYSKKNSEVTFFRDRVGVKPLYYSYSKNGIIASSECKAIISALKNQNASYRPKICKEALIDNMLYGHALAPFTMFADISSLEAGSYITLDLKNSKIEKTKYWDLEVDNEYTDQNLCQENIARILEDSIRLRCKSDVGHGLMLSGGLDSSLIGYILGKQNNNCKAYTIGNRSEQNIKKSFVSGSDIEFANIVANEAGHELFICEDIENNLINDLREISLAKDHVVTLANEMAMLKVFKEIKGNDTVILSGDGADEAFLGYFMMINKKITPFYSSESSKYLFGMFNKDFLSSKQAESIAWSNFESRLSDIDEQIKKSKQKLMHYLQLKFTLPYLLDRADRISSNFSLELRVPYCDHRLLEYVFNVSNKLKFKKVEKKLLRDSFKEEFNNDVLYRKKSVFPYSNSDYQINLLRSTALSVIKDSVDNDGILSKIYKTKFLSLFFENNYLFNTLKMFAGVFYIQALLCQIISLHFLDEKYKFSI
ncbi:asparagine synthase (glutamine-hydrolyzing) [Acinetobacter sp. XH1741]|uniref:asparagine synthase (glutamine-hydrolyzing) n=1 Tax=unclassified Acinetobacter TaxID=196816 RepID=UPI0032B523B7